MMSWYVDNIGKVLENIWRKIWGAGNNQHNKVRERRSFVRHEIISVPFLSRCIFNSRFTADQLKFSPTR